jgi:hypothetical protein
LVPTSSLSFYHRLEAVAGRVVVIREAVVLWVDILVELMGIRT